MAVPMWLCSVFCLTLPLAAQAGGLRSGTSETPHLQRLGAPEPAVAERLITIEAQAEVRVVPSRLRIVFAVSASGPTASEASAAGRALLAQTKGKLVKAGLVEADLDTDFIAAVPIYGWSVGNQGGKDVLVEKRSGFRVQYNLHAYVADEAGALVAIEAATAGDGIDVIAVDYWSDNLAKKQSEAQQQALKAAQAKAALLLSVFPVTPTPVNVHESTRVLFPQQLYQTLPRVEDSAGNWYSRDEMPRVPASRPIQTYYRGLFEAVDAGSPVMPGKREIEVVSTVRLYYAAPERPLIVK